jgi:hypothetical protein
MDIPFPDDYRASLLFTIDEAVPRLPMIDSSYFFILQKLFAKYLHSQDSNRLKRNRTKLMSNVH